MPTKRKNKKLKQKQKQKQRQSQNVNVSVKIGQNDKKEKSPQVISVPVPQYVQAPSVQALPSQFSSFTNPSMPFLQNAMNALPGAQSGSISGASTRSSSMLSDWMNQAELPSVHPMSDFNLSLDLSPVMRKPVTKEAGIQQGESATQLEKELQQQADERIERNRRAMGEDFEGFVAPPQPSEIDQMIAREREMLQKMESENTKLLSQQQLMTPQPQLTTRGLGSSVKLEDVSDESAYKTAGSMRQSLLSEYIPGLQSPPKSPEKGLLSAPRKSSMKKSTSLMERRFGFGTAFTPTPVKSQIVRIPKKQQEAEIKKFHDLVERLEQEFISTGIPPSAHFEENQRKYEKGELPWQKEEKRKKKDI